MLPEGLTVMFGLAFMSDSSLAERTDALSSSMDILKRVSVGVGGVTVVTGAATMPVGGVRGRKLVSKLGIVLEVEIGGKAS